MQPSPRACKRTEGLSRRNSNRRHDVNLEILVNHPLQGRTLPLTTGLGVGNPYDEAHDDSVLFGPELEFGNVVGNHIKKQVLLRRKERWVQCGAPGELEDELEAASDELHAAFGLVDLEAARSP